MSTDENKNNDFKNIIKLKQSEALKQNGLVNDSIYYTNTNDVKISLNHAINADIIFTIDKKKWHKNLDKIVEQAEEYGIYDKESLRLLKYHLNDNYDEIIGAFSSINTNTTTNTNHYDNSDENDKPKREITTLKYPQLGKGHLSKKFGGLESDNVFVLVADNKLDFYKIVEIAHKMYKMNLDIVLNQTIVKRVFTIYQLADFLIRELAKDIKKFESKLVIITGDFFLNDSYIEKEEKIGYIFK